MGRNSQVHSKAAFTLIEVIVVIAIMAILAGLLFPVFARSKQSAKEAANLQNLKQISQGLFLYASDNEDVIPTWWEPAFNRTNGIPDFREASPVDVWDGKLVPYVRQGNAPMLESQLKRDGVWRSPLSEDSDSFRSYGINQMAVFRWIPEPDGSFDRTKYAWRHLALAAADRPSSTIIIGDGGREGRLAPSINWDGWSDLYEKKLGYYRREAPWRYSGRAGYVFLDGHAALLPGDDLFPSPKLKSDAGSSGIFGLGHCAVARAFVPFEIESQWHSGIASHKHGVICQSR